MAGITMENLMHRLESFGWVIDPNQSTPLVRVFRKGTKVVTLAGRMHDIVSPAIVPCGM